MRTLPIFSICLAFASLNFVALSSNQAAAFDTAKIEGITGLKGSTNKDEGVFKVTSPRTDIPISVDGWSMPPFMGLTTWAAFLPEKSGAMVMGDFVLFQDEVNPALDAALGNGLDVTALHNHFFYDDPKVYFMHIGGSGSAESLATGVRKVLDAVKAVRSANATPAKSFDLAGLPPKSSITPAPLEKILGLNGQSKDGMFKVVVGREAKMSCGCTVGKEMGVNTWAAFAGSDDNAVVDGDFVVREDELQPVLKSLRASGINIVAIHQHMTGETPRYIFLHYWGRGPADKLAQAVKSALGKTSK